MPDALDWENLRLFGALLRHRSFAAAGRALGVDPTTLSRRLTALEDQLGAVLFRRTSGGLRTTEAAEAIAPTIEGMERRVARLRDAAIGGAARVEGVVRLATTDVVARALIIPHLDRLRAVAPGLDLELA